MYSVPLNLVKNTLSAKLTLTSYEISSEYHRIKFRHLLLQGLSDRCYQTMPPVEAEPVQPLQFSQTAKPLAWYRLNI